MITYNISNMKTSIHLNIFWVPFVLVKSECLFSMSDVSISTDLWPLLQWKHVNSLIAFYPVALFQDGLCVGMLCEMAAAVNAASAYIMSLLITHPRFKPVLSRVTSVNLDDAFRAPQICGNTLTLPPIWFVMPLHTHKMVWKNCTFNCDVW